MDKARNDIKGTSALAKRIIRNAIAGTLLTLAFTACAHRNANADIKPNIYYEFYQNTIYSLSYSLARDAMMKDLYEPALRDGAPVGNPLIGIGEVDLNGDNMPEIIAFPTEEEEENGMYCEDNGMCPHYILQVRGNNVHRLGIIFANTVMLGDNINNGYWELLAYKNGNEDPKKADIYTYDKNKDQYRLKTQPGAKP